MLEMSNVNSFGSNLSKQIDLTINGNNTFPINENVYRRQVFVMVMVKGGSLFYMVFDITNSSWILY